MLLLSNKGIERNNNPWERYECISQLEVLVEIMPPTNFLNFFQASPFLAAVLQNTTCVVPEIS